MQNSENNSHSDNFSADVDDNAYYDRVKDVDKSKQKRYNKSIKVSKLAYRLITSQRMAKYPSLDEYDPSEDVINIGEQGKLNTNTKNYIKNYGRNGFVVYKKQLDSPKKGTSEYEINIGVDRRLARHSDINGDNGQNNIKNDSDLSANRRGAEIRDRRIEQNTKSDGIRRNSDSSRTARRIKI